jgi:sugar phosphate isomerase/epimerase
MAFKIGCQTITFGDEAHKKNIEAVLDSVKAAGYSGLEMGFFRLDPEKGPEYKAMLEKRGLALTAIHVGGNILDAASQSEQMDNLDLVIRLVKQLGGSLVFLSGGRQESYEAQAARYDALGARVRDAGLSLCYHNHDWEIEDNYAGLETLLEKTKAENMSLVLDAGWVRQGGGDPVKAVKDYGSRLKHVHFKEFTSEGGFAELGTGIVDFKAVCEALRRRKEDMWIVAEQDQSKIGADASVKKNFAYIRSLLES